MIHRIKTKLPLLSRSERLVAETILNNVDAAVSTSIQSLAERAGVSEPTVVRFCRTLGTSGFQEFKVELAKSLGNHDTFFFQHLTKEDDVSTLSAKIIDSAVASLIHVKQQLDTDSIESAIRLYNSCSRAEFYGSGGSGVVAEDAQLKFFRLGKPVVAYSDPHIQHAAAALLDKSSLVIAISASGQNRDLIHTLGIARKSGAKILAITSVNSDISEISDCSVTLEVSEDNDTFSPLKSRLAQMVVLDIIAVGVAARGGKPAIDRIKKARRAIDFKFQSKA
ncbi:MAG: MurR/RpiR family transcriptional regulator [Pseudomonadota bacterium]